MMNCEQLVACISWQHSVLITVGEIIAEFDEWLWSWTSHLSLPWQVSPGEGQIALPESVHFALVFSGTAWPSEARGRVERGISRFNTIRKHVWIHRGGMSAKGNRERGAGADVTIAVKSPPNRENFRVDGLRVKSWFRHVFLVPDKTINLCQRD